VKGTGTTFLMFSSINSNAQGYFQQDGATPRETFRYLRQFFDDRLISRNLWPALPHLKNTIFKEVVHTIDDFKSRVKEDCERVTP
jgi:hypothetical protein